LGGEVLTVPDVEILEDDDEEEGAAPVAAPWKG